MSDILVFIVGAMIGSMVSISLFAMLSINRFNDLNQEIADLRIARRLLKEETLKLTEQLSKRKPQPRKRRKNYNKNTLK